MIKMVIPGDEEKILFTTLGGGDYSSRATIRVNMVCMQKHG